MKYKLTKTIESVGKAGDIVDLSDEEFMGIAYNSTLTLLDSVDERESMPKFEAKKDEELFLDELINEVGFSKKRARKVLSHFSTKDELLSNIDKLPFSDVENETLRSAFDKVSKKKSKKSMESEQ